MRSALKEVLLSTVLQCLPLFLIRWKSLESSNRLALLSRFSLKVMLMFFALFINRMLTFPFTLTLSHDGEMILNVLYTLAVGAILHVVFEMKWSTLMKEHRDVIGLQIFAFLYACLTTAMFSGSRGFHSGWLVGAFWNAMEICTFMPGVWLILQMRKADFALSPFANEAESSKRHALYLAGFLNVFYLIENIYAPYATSKRWYNPLFVAGHITHYLMVLEFTMFFLWQASFSPAAIGGTKPAQLEEI